MQSAESSTRFAIARLNLPNSWLAGCAVRNTVWRSLLGKDCQLAINDFDIAFFYALGDWFNFPFCSGIAEEAPRRSEACLKWVNHIEINAKFQGETLEDYES